jgi:cleavage and polyadenylation specificity factor subunit 1
MWSLPIRQPSRTAGNTPERPLDPLQGDNDSLIISTDVNPSPGLSRVNDFSLTVVADADLYEITQLAHRGPKTDITISVRIPGTTIGAGSFMKNTAILHVTTNAIRVLEPGELTPYVFSLVLILHHL